MTPALDGIRVVEVTHAMAGQMAGMVLADNGASVVRVEPPGGGRARGQAGFVVWNRGKAAIAADLTTTAGHDRLGDLVRSADVFIEDLRGPTVDRLDLSYQALRLLNPDLVYVAITGFGERGPLRDLPGYEYMVSAASGRMADQATIAGTRPAFTPVPIVSFGASMLAVQGALAALHHRWLGGGGQRVHTSLLHALVTLDMTSGHGHRIHLVDKSGRVYGVMPLAFMTAQCKDGRYVQMCSRFPHQFRNWMRVLELESLYDDPAYGQMPDVLPSQQALDALVETVRQRMAARTMDEWLEVFSAEGVGANPFLSPAEFFGCEQARVNGSVVEIDDPVLGRLVEVGPIAHLSATPAAVTASAPPIGSLTSSTDSAAVWPATRGARLPATTSDGPARRYPLEGITVVECGFAYAAPQAMTLLAEMGARVIKVEPPAGDPSRRNWTTTYAKECAGKESVVVDLKSDAGREVLYRLVERADIFLHNFRPGVPEKLRVDFDTLHRLNPRLVYVYGSCFGSTGPWSHLPGFHSSPNAIVGTGSVEAGSGNPPQNRTFGDPAGALALGASTLLALIARDRTGQGQYVEGTMLTSLAYAVSHYSVQGGDLPPPPLATADQRGLSPWCRLYETADGWLALSVVTPGEQGALLRLVATESDRPAGREGDSDAVLQAAFTEAFRSKGASEWEAQLLAAGVPAVRADGINLFDFMLRSEQMQANGLVVEEDIEGVGTISRSTGSVEFSATPHRIGTTVPLGHDTARVLGELGYDTETIERLEASGVTRVVGQGLEG